MADTKFSGSFVALVTPFLDGAIDEKALVDLVNWHVDEGTSGLVPLGTTGECATLSHDEHKRAVEMVIAAADRRVPVIAGAGSNSTAEAIELSLHAQRAGADGVLVVTPYYNKPTQRGLVEHFSAIEAALDIPIIIYNIPGRSVVDMSVETMAALAQLKYIVGVKDATCDMARVSAQRRACGPEFIQLSGEDVSVPGFLVHGGSGTISVTANVAPGLMAALHAAAFAGNMKEVLRLQDQLFLLHTALFEETNPAPVKYALARMGRIQEEIRLPLVPVTAETRASVDRALSYAGLI